MRVGGHRALPELLLALDDRRLDRVQRGEHPGNCARPGIGVTGQQAGSRVLIAIPGTDGYDAAGHRSHTGPVIDTDALWSCTTCGACVEQCPVDIEHIDHFVDMRRYQVMIESEFPTELNGLFKNVEQKGNPWGMNASMRNAWIEEVDFEVRVFGMDGEDEIPDDVEYLFWVGCAGAYEDRAKRTTKSVAELLHIAGVEFMVMGEGETCTGDPARRAGNEFVYQMQAMQKGAPLDLCFQSIAGSEGANRNFGVSVALLDEALRVAGVAEAGQAQQVVAEQQREAGIEQRLHLAAGHRAVAHAERAARSVSRVDCRPP